MTTERQSIDDQLAELANQYPNLCPRALGEARVVAGEVEQVFGVTPDIFSGEDGGVSVEWGQCGSYSAVITTYTTGMFDGADYPWGCFAFATADEVEDWLPEEEAICNMRPKEASGKAWGVWLVAMGHSVRTWLQRIRSDMKEEE